MGTNTIGGHVFVVKADVTAISCDAWLCPTDAGFSVSGWRTALGTKRSRLEGYEWGDKLALEFKPGSRRPANAPLIVLGRVGKSAPRTDDEVKAHVQDLVKVIREFVAVAKRTRRRTLKESQILRLALPLIGTRRAGLRGVKGDVIKPIIDELNYQSDAGIDLILCIDNELNWSAVQSVRAPHEWTLSKSEEKLAGFLASEARAGRLVLFIGAGAGRDAGMPGWQQLLGELSPSSLSTAERTSLSGLDPRDAATLIEHRLGGREPLLEKIAKLIGGDERPVGLTHALLASLGTKEAVTTNYDELFERACTEVGQPVDHAVTVLPYGPVQPGRPWLLKLHGSLSHRDEDGRDDIVLTRRDYLALRRHRAALYGIVQALLVTKHLLFVGYSLTDEDFHELVDEIRTALGPIAGSQRQLGTVLTISYSPLADLWKDLLRVEQLGTRGEPPGRRLQMLLDRVAHLATPRHTYLLDKEFDGLLTDDERVLKGRLKEVERVVADSDSHAASTVRQILETLGAPHRGGQ